MDRELRVMKDGAELATLVYDYENPTSGKVKITINRIYDLGDDMKSVYPLYEFETYFNHQAFTALEQLKAFDKELLKKQSDFEEHVNAPLEYLYDAVEYRYVITHRDVVGIATVKANFEDNTREVGFVSARRMKEDFNLQANSFDSNKALLKRYCEEYLDCYGSDFKRVGWN